MLDVVESFARDVLAHGQDITPELLVSRDALLALPWKTIEQPAPEPHRDTVRLYLVRAVGRWSITAEASPEAIAWLDLPGLDLDAVGRLAARQRQKLQQQQTRA